MGWRRRARAALPTWLLVISLVLVVVVFEFVVLLAVLKRVTAAVLVVVIRVLLLVQVPSLLLPHEARLVATLQSQAGEDSGWTQGAVGERRALRGDRRPPAET